MNKNNGNTNGRDEMETRDELNPGDILTAKDDALDRVIRLLVSGDDLSPEVRRSAARQCLLAKEIENGMDPVEATKRIAKLMDR